MCPVLELLQRKGGKDAELAAALSAALVRKGPTPVISVPVVGNLQDKRGHGGDLEINSAQGFDHRTKGNLYQRPYIEARL